MVGVGIISLMKPLSQLHKIYWVNHPYHRFTFSFQHLLVYWWSVPLNEEFQNSFRTKKKVNVWIDHSRELNFSRMN